MSERRDVSQDAGAAQEGSLPDGCEIDPAGAISVPLEHPIRHGSEEIRSLSIRRPKLKHLKAMDSARGDMGKTQHLIVKLADLPPSVVEELDIDDLAKVSEVINHFFAKFQTAGGIP